MGSFQANAFDVHDMHGNVYEWVEDCRNDSYRAAPSDGGAWPSEDCGWRVLRSGSWASRAKGVRSASRGANITGTPDRRPRIPCGPDAHALNLYPLTFLGVSKGTVAPLVRALKGRNSDVDCRCRLSLLS